MDLKHSVIRNDVLGAYLSQHKAELLQSCRRLLKRNAGLGHYLGAQVITPNMRSPVLQKEHALYRVLSVFEHLHPDWYCGNFELHIKTNASAPTPLHSDVYTWLHSDAYQTVQLWVLLYNDADSHNLDLYRSPRNALYDANAGMLLGYDDGGELRYEAYPNPKRIFDGAQLNIGDILVFENGAIHGTRPPASTQSTTYRMAVAVTYFKKTWKLTDGLLRRYADFWRHDASEYKYVSQQQLRALFEHPYARKIIGNDRVRVLLENVVKAKNDKRIKGRDDAWYDAVSTATRTLTLEPQHADTRLAKWERRYAADKRPVWDRDEVSPLLEKILRDKSIYPDRVKTVLSLGCGTGTNEIYLANQGYAVTGIDISPTAIAQANAKKAACHGNVTFVCGNVLGALRAEQGYDLVFDRGCYHHLRYVSVEKYLEALESVSHAATRYVLISCNAESAPGVTEQNMRDDFAGKFVIEHIENVMSVDSRYGHLRDEWILVMRRQA